MNAVVQIHRNVILFKLSEQHKTVFCLSKTDKEKSKINDFLNYLENIEEIEQVNDKLIKIKIRNEGFYLAVFSKQVVNESYDKRIKIISDIIPNNYTVRFISEQEQLEKISQINTTNKLAKEFYTSSITDNKYNIILENEIGKKFFLKPDLNDVEYSEIIEYDNNILITNDSELMKFYTDIEKNRKLINHYITIKENTVEVEIQSKTMFENNEKKTFIYNFENDIFNNIIFFDNIKFKLDSGNLIPLFETINIEETIAVHNKTYPDYKLDNEKLEDIVISIAKIHYIKMRSIEVESLLNRNSYEKMEEKQYVDFLIEELSDKERRLFDNNKFILNFVLENEYKKYSNKYLNTKYNFKGIFNLNKDLNYSTSSFFTQKMDFNDYFNIDDSNTLFLLREYDGQQIQIVFPTNFYRNNLVDLIEKFNRNEPFFYEEYFFLSKDTNYFLLDDKFINNIKLLNEDIVFIDYSRNNKTCRSAFPIINSNGENMMIQFEIDEHKCSKERTIIKTIDEIQIINSNIQNSLENKPYLLKLYQKTNEYTYYIKFEDKLCVLNLEQSRIDSNVINNQEKILDDFELKNEKEEDLDMLEEDFFDQTINDIQWSSIFELDKYNSNHCVVPLSIPFSLINRNKEVLPNIHRISWIPYTSPHTSKKMFYSNDSVKTLEPYTLDFIEVFLDKELTEIKRIGFKGYYFNDIINNMLMKEFDSKKPFLSIRDNGGTISLRDNHKEITFVKQDNNYIDKFYAITRDKKIETNFYLQFKNIDFEEISFHEKLLLEKSNISTNFLLVNKDLYFFDVNGELIETNDIFKINNKLTFELNDSIFESKTEDLTFINYKEEKVYLSIKEVKDKIILETFLTNMNLPLLDKLKEKRSINLSF